MRPRATVVTLSEAEEVAGLQDQALTAMIHTGTAGAVALSGGTVRMPPGRVSKAHMHAHSEIIVAVLSGDAVTVVWEEGEPRPLRHSAGALCYVPAGVAHCAINLSTVTEVRAYEFRTDPAFNSDVVLLPDLELAVSRLAVQLRANHQGGDPQLARDGTVPSLGVSS